MSRTPDLTEAVTDLAAAVERRVAEQVRDLASSVGADTGSASQTPARFSREDADYYARVAIHVLKTNGHQISGDRDSVLATLGAAIWWALLDADLTRMTGVRRPRHPLPDEPKE